MIVFITSYYNHHQAALAKCLDIQTMHSFTFIETEPMAAERKNMGWSNADAPAYVRKAYTSEQDRAECQKLINDADVVIWGSCPFGMIQPRLKAGKLTFCYSERLFKKGFGAIAFGGRAVKYWLKHWRYQKNHYLLCASAYAASDYAKIGLFRNRAFKWGYFPECGRKKSLDEIIAQKQPASILWAGRMIDWKHPETALEIAKQLKQEGIPFEMNIIGDGACFANIQSSYREFGLDKQVHLLGAKSPEQVREYMEMSDVYLFTSDFNEGWGAVVNEAMSSACAVVASDAAGSVRYLIKNQENGLVYHNGLTEELYQHVVSLLKERSKCHLYGRCAFETMSDEWSADTAAARFIALSQSMLNRKELSYSNGPCSQET